MSANRLIRITLTVVILSAAAIVTGCARVGVVSGTVTYKNVPLKSGSVTIMTPGGALQDSIKEDGTYLIKNVPTGDARVSVVCTDDAKMVSHIQDASVSGRTRKGGIHVASMATPSFSHIPEVYGDLVNTPLQTSIKRGKNTYNIELK
jgi:hypothetical protein